MGRASVEAVSPRSWGCPQDAAAGLSEQVQSPHSGLSWGGLGESRTLAALGGHLSRQASREGDSQAGGPGCRWGQHSPGFRPAPLPDPPDALQQAQAAHGAAPGPWAPVLGSCPHSSEPWPSQAARGRAARGELPTTHHSLHSHREHRTSQRESPGNVQRMHGPPAGMPAYSSEGQRREPARGPLWGDPEGVSSGPCSAVSGLLQ